MGCPYCGSTAQVKVLATEYIENGWVIEVERTYSCGCGALWEGKSRFECRDCYEEIKIIGKA